MTTPATRKTAWQMEWVSESEAPEDWDPPLEPEWRPDFFRGVDWPEGQEIPWGKPADREGLYRDRDWPAGQYIGISYADPEMIAGMIAQYPRGMTAARTAPAPGPIAGVRQPHPSTMTTEIVPTLQAARLRARMTQQELADKSGIAVSTISRIESGLTSRLRKGTWDALAAALEVPIDEIATVRTRPLTADEIAHRQDAAIRRREREAERQRRRRQQERDSERQRASA